MNRDLPILYATFHGADDQFGSAFTNREFATEAGGRIIPYVSAIRLIALLGELRAQRKPELQDAIEEIEERLRGAGV